MQRKNKYYIVNNTTMNDTYYAIYRTLANKLYFTKFQPPHFFFIQDIFQLLVSN